MTRQAGAVGRKTRRAAECGFLSALFAPVLTRFKRAGPPIGSKQLKRGTATNLKCRSHPRRGSKPTRLDQRKNEAVGAPSFSPHRSGALSPHRPFAVSPFRPVALSHHL